MIEVKDGSDTPSLAGKYVEGSGGRGGVHNFEAYSAAGKCEHEFAGWKKIPGAGSDNDQLRIGAQQHAKVINSKRFNRPGLPVRHQLFGR